MSGEPPDWVVAVALGALVVVGLKMAARGPARDKDAKPNDPGGEDVRPTPSSSIAETLLTATLIPASAMALLTGYADLSEAMEGIGSICLACWLGIWARIAQAHFHQNERREAQSRAMLPGDGA